MTEAEWLACNDPQAMLARLGGRISDRQLRLFACACCRQVWALLTDAGSRQAVEVAERFADGRASQDELTAASDAARAAARATARDDAWGAAWGTARGAAWTAVWAAASNPGPGAAWAAQAALLHDIVGNPFAPAPSAQVAYSPLVCDLAEAAYVERDETGRLDPVRLAILADALEEAGCISEIVSHLRSPGPHYRGCWALDLLLSGSLSFGISRGPCAYQWCGASGPVKE